jgi:hypothetical protein
MHGRPRPIHGVFGGSTQAAERRLWTRRGSAVAPSDCAPTTRPPLQGRVTLCRPFGSPQVCDPCGCIPSTLTRSSERLGHGFSPRFCRRAHQKRGGEQGRCSSGCPGRARRAGNVGAGLPGLAALWVVGSRDEIGPPLFPAPSRAPAAVPDHTGHAAHLAIFSNGWRSAVAQPYQAVHQLRFSSCWNTKRDVLDHESDGSVISSTSRVCVTHDTPASATPGADTRCLDVEATTHKPHTTQVAGDAGR